MVLAHNYANWTQLVVLEKSHKQSRNILKKQESQLVESKINNCVVEQQQNQKLTQKEKDTWKMGSDNPSNTL